MELTRFYSANDIRFIYNLRSQQIFQHQSIDVSWSLATFLQIFQISRSSQIKKPIHTRSLPIFKNYDYFVCSSLGFHYTDICGFFSQRLLFRIQCFSFFKYEVSLKLNLQLHARMAILIKHNTFIFQIFSLQMSLLVVTKIIVRNETNASKLHHENLVAP